MFTVKNNERSRFTKGSQNALKLRKGMGGTLNEDGNIEGINNLN